MNDCKYNLPLLLQHHAFRSYLGLACLIQVSTREKDYIVDPLKLRGKVTVLNEVFTNPKITKVSFLSTYFLNCIVAIGLLYLANQSHKVYSIPSEISNMSGVAPKLRKKWTVG